MNLNDIKIEHNIEAQQFYIKLEGKIANLDYKKIANYNKIDFINNNDKKDNDKKDNDNNEDNKILDYYHTYVPEEFRGQKIGEKLVKYALEYAKKNEYKIIPTCSFVKRYIDLNPEYSSMVYR